MLVVRIGVAASVVSPHGSGSTQPIRNGVEIFKTKKMKFENFCTLQITPKEINDFQLS